MIILDPDLDPAPAPPSIPVKRPSAQTPPEKSLSLRMPSARTLARFLAAAQAAVRLKGEVNVLLTTDTAIRNLNRRFRGKNKATDVLSFPAEAPMPGASSEKIAGDLAISVPTALGQAVGQGHALSVEIKVLILHGLLHLAGYDHESDAGKMARRERLLRARLHLPQGLIERTTPVGKKPDPPKRPGAPSFPRPLAERVGNHKTHPEARPSPPSRVPQVSILRPGIPQTTPRTPSKRGPRP